jgi:photosystem II stability/assembly factor-like uncharacterized protein
MLKPDMTGQTADHIAVTADGDCLVISSAGGLCQDRGRAVQPFYAHHAGEIRACGRLGLADDH